MVGIIIEVRMKYYKSLTFSEMVCGVVNPTQDKLFGFISIDF